MSLKLKNENSFLEKIGTKYFQRLHYKSSANDETLLKDIPSDKILDAISDVIIKNATIIAFLIGAIVTIPLVFFEIIYYDRLSIVDYLIQYGIYSVISLIIELLLLYWITLQSIYALLHLIGRYPEEDETLPEVYFIDRVLIRTALELEEPILEFMGVDPRKRLSKVEMFLMAFLYKLKVILSSFLIKKALKAIMPRLGARAVILPFVDVFIVAFWDAYVINRSLKDAKLRLFGYYFSKYLVKEILIKKIEDKNFSIDIEGAVRAIASIIALSKSNHPNNLILLIMLSSHSNIEEIDEPDNIERFREYLSKLDKKEQHYLKMLSIITAILDDKLTKEEKEGIVHICGEDKKYYLKLMKDMKKLLNQGRIHELTKTVIEEFDK